MEQGPGTLHQNPPDGCYIYGLHLEGCRWDPIEKCLIESRPKELYTMMPVVWLIPEANRVKPEDGVYDCPVYKTLTRSGKFEPLIISIFLKRSLNVSTQYKLRYKP